MKFLAAALIAGSVLATPVLAETTGTEEKDLQKSRLDLCVVIQETAGAIMMRRQEGVPMVKVMEIVKDDDILRPLARKAYSMPRYRTPENQAGAVTDFADEVYMDCLDIMEGRN